MLEKYTTKNETLYALTYTHGDNNNNNNLKKEKKNGVK